MPTPGDGQWEAVARKARRVQDAVDQVRGRAVVDGVRIEVAVDGRITALELPDTRTAQVISTAHEQARRRALEQAVPLRAELIADSAVTAALRALLRPGSDRPNTTAPRVIRAEPVDEQPNCYALPPHLQRRFGLA